MTTPNKEVEIKSCPFCGEIAMIERDKFKAKHWPKNEDCPLKGMSIYLKQWNHRTTTPEQ